MQKRVIAALTIVLVVIIAFSAVQYISSAELFLFQKNISFVAISQTEGNSTMYVYYANASDSSTVVASLYVRVEQDLNNQRRVRIDMQHEGNTELDKVTLKFQSRDIGAVYFEGYAETLYSISRVGQSFTAVVSYSQALGQIEGSTPLEFIIRTTNDGDSDFNLYLQTDLSMHYKQPLQLTQLKASSGLNINLQ